MTRHHEPAQSLTTLMVSEVDISASSKGKYTLLKTCMNQLAGAFKDIFNFQLQQSDVPSCFKRVSIVLVLQTARLPVSVNTVR